MPPELEAMIVSFLVVLPVIILSGYGYPISVMPRAMQLISYLNPLRYYLTVIQACFIKGEGLAALWPEILWLAVLALVLSAGTAKRISQTLT